MELNLKPIGEHSYSFREGFTLCSMMPDRKEGMRQIDWDTVKAILEMKEFDKIEVGLAEDYYQTHTTIFKDNKIIILENDGAGFFGASRWATPAIKLYQDDESMLFECWVNGNKTDFPDWLEAIAEKHICEYEEDDDCDDYDEYEEE